MAEQRYDFKHLIQAVPELASYVFEHPQGGLTVDFSDPTSVMLLNKALLKHDYKIEHWSLPPDHLCPPVPSRADYIHQLSQKIKKKNVRALDIGVGANCIYPLIGQKLGWHFVGTDIDPQSLAWAQKLIDENKLQGRIKLRLQPSPQKIFEDVIDPEDVFDVALCNPPFYSSQVEAQRESARKWKHLGVAKKGDHRNFGGKSHELWCEGGEQAFLKKMALESVKFSKQIRWFSTLVSREAHLKNLDRTLEKLKAHELHVIDMAHGQKKARIAIWTFLPAQ